MLCLLYGEMMCAIHNPDPENYSIGINYLCKQGSCVYCDKRRSQLVSIDKEMAVELLKNFTVYFGMLSGEIGFVSWWSCVSGHWHWLPETGNFFCIKDAMSELAFPESQPTKNSQTQLSKSVLLEKKLEKQAPQLINLANKLSVSLEKKQLQDTIARVAIAVDASGSMSSSYQNGSVQSVLDRIALVAARLDDDGNLETWFYASEHAKFPDITIENVVGYLKKHVKSSFSNIVKELGAGNNEPPVMQEILSAYKSSNLPALIIFITDGGIFETDKIKKILIAASIYPIFWQFVGLAGSNYGVLENLDNMEGRTVDNADFFAVDDLAKIEDEELYDRLLSEFPCWLKEARKKGIVA
jgi:hypothetical protein